MAPLQCSHISNFDPQWRNDWVAAASRDGGPHWQGGPRQFQVLND